MIRRHVSSNAYAVPAVFMRGGTSKGMFFHEEDLVPAGAERDALILDIMGSPDALQLDGMGGGLSSLSKVMIVAPAESPEFDVRYLFGQVGIDAARVDWAGNCGNLTSAVAVFAIEEGLVAGHGSESRIRMLNENTGVTVIATVRLTGGLPEVIGTHSIAGVPGTGSPVATFYQHPSGGVLGSAFPTGRRRNRLHVHGQHIDVTLADITTPHVLLRAEDVGIVGPIDSDTPAELNGDAELRDWLEQIRRAAAVELGLADSVSSAGQQSPVLPRLILLQSPGAAGDAELVAMGLSMGKFHRGLMVTGALCAGGCALMPGTIAAESAELTSREHITIATPLGPIEVLASISQSNDDHMIESLGVIRTARRLMSGVAYAKCSPAQVHRG